jgi:hypothetical protein
MGANTQLTLVIVVLAVVLGVAGYAQRQDRPAQAAAAATDDKAPINACALLSDQEVAAAVGAEVSPGQRHDEGEVGGVGDYASSGTYSSTCLWRFKADIETPSDPNLPMGGKRFAILNAILWPKGSGEAEKFLKSFHDAAEHEVIPGKPIPLTGIGDDALWWGDGVAARSGDTSFGVSVFLQNGDKPTQRAIEEGLAKKIAPRL